MIVRGVRSRSVSLRNYPTISLREDNRVGGSQFSNVWIIHTSATMPRQTRAIVRARDSFLTILHTLYTRQLTFEISGEANLWTRIFISCERENGTLGEQCFRDKKMENNFTSGYHLESTVCYCERCLKVPFYINIHTLYSSTSSCLLLMYHVERNIVASLMWASYQQNHFFVF